MAVKAKAEITLYKIISVDKVVRYYLLQSSTLAAPSKPADGAVIGSNWSKTEPSYTSGSTSTLYFVDQTVLSNGALKYSEVSKSSSYEAAKEAWNKANNAQKTANDAIADTYQEYYLSASQTALSGGSWSTTAPTYVRLGQTISMGNGMGSGFLKLNTGCIQMYPTTLADTNGNGNTGKFELHAGGSYPYIIFGDYNTNDEAKKEKGRYSVRIGGSNTVSGNCSVAIGYSSDVSGKNSTAIGHYLKNISDNQLLIGKYNISSDYPFIIGNGSSDTERSNALTVDWDGNITGKSLTSANDLKLGFGSSNIFKPYFTKGDSITLTIYAVGYVTTRGKEVAMYVPLSRPIIAGGSVSVASVNGLTIRQNGKYLYSSSASNSVNPSSFRAAIVGSGCGVNIVATFGNTVNATVNDACSITASIKITFS